VADKVLGLAGGHDQIVFALPGIVCHHLSPSLCGTQLIPLMQAQGNDEEEAA
jgi:ABC-type sulfate transport system permease subunit